MNTGNFKTSDHGDRESDISNLVSVCHSLDVAYNFNRGKVQRADDQVAVFYNACLF